MQTKIKSKKTKKITSKKKVKKIIIDSTKEIFEDKYLMAKKGNNKLILKNTPIKYKRPESESEINIEVMKKNIKQTSYHFHDYYDFLVKKYEKNKKVSANDLKTLYEIHDEFNTLKLKLFMKQHMENSPLIEQLNAMERRINSCIYTITYLVEAK